MYAGFRSEHRWRNLEKLFLKNAEYRQKLSGKMINGILG